MCGRCDGVVARIPWRTSTRLTSWQPSWSHANCRGSAAARPARDRSRRLATVGVTFEPRSVGPDLTARFAQDARARQRCVVVYQPPLVASAVERWPMKGATLPGRVRALAPRAGPQGSIVYANAGAAASAVLLPAPKKPGQPRRRGPRTVAAAAVRARVSYELLMRWERSNLRGVL